jgi:hypothetical protein
MNQPRGEDTNQIGASSVALVGVCWLLAALQLGLKKAEFN